MMSNTEAIVASFKSGQPLRQIGVTHGLSGENVRQFLVQQGFGRLAVGRASARINSRTTEAERRELRSMKVYGMPKDERDAHIEQYGGARVRGSPMCAYKEQRANAQKRGIEWNFTFKQWWQVWLDSGKWASRGCRRGNYVMARYGDGNTPYGPGAVYICTVADNLEDGLAFGPKRHFKKKG